MQDKLVPNPEKGKAAWPSLFLYGTPAVVDVSGFPLRSNPETPDIRQMGRMEVSWQKAPGAVTGAFHNEFG